MTESQCKTRPYEKIEEEITDYGFGYRHVQSILLFGVFSTAYIIRASMSVAIVAMTDVNSDMTGVEVYDWNKKTQDIILSSFYWGYVINQIPGGQFAHKYGGKVLILLGMFTNGLILMAMPLTISMGGWKAACASRTLQGLFQSPIMPSMNTLLSKWAPVNERGRHNNFIVAGTSFGTVVGMLVSGYLSGNYGWPKTFQIIGAWTILMGILFFFFCANSPSAHKKISKEEKCFIQASLGYKFEEKSRKTPWKSIVTSPKVWIFIVAITGMNWVVVIMMLETPSFLNKVLKVDTEMSGIFTAIPYITMWVFGFICSIISDYIITHKYLSIQKTRKIFSAIAAWGVAAGLAILSFIPNDRVALSVCFLTMSVGAISAINVGFMLNPIELAPNFTGPVIGIGNCIANVIGILAPISAGYILNDPTDSTQWRTVFYLTASIAILSNIAFLIFGVSKIQPWNEPFNDDIEMKQKQIKTDVEKDLLKSQLALKNN